MSSLRARCPDCRTFTAVALGDGYECHRCGRTFGAGLVRVPRAWGSGGEAMAEGARLAVPYPEVGVVEEETLAAQSDALAEMLSQGLPFSEMLLRLTSEPHAVWPIGGPARDRLD